MRAEKKRRLQKAGWAVGTAYEFLELDEEERAYVETKLALAQALRERRHMERITQSDLADRLGSSQSRVAKMEAADPSVTLDLLMRSLFSLGATQAEVARIIRRGASRSAA
jgi:DNA-binding XRE family transcriptional regulator